MATRKPPVKTAASPPKPQDTPEAGSATPPASPPGMELSAAAPLEPPTAPPAPEPAPSPEPPTQPGITAHQPLVVDHTDLVGEDGNELPRDLAELFDLTHPEWTVVYPRLRIYQRRTYTGSRRTVTQLLYTPAQSIPRAEFDQLQRALGGE
ncbi:hypothetical protein [Streptomyces sp. CB01881]|uniref:hypothetical protein n=1 Tax=Streptomyces sp. CB01881 TaxID=2078691 RepID=UPI000CDC95C8|nr:hypothetical protein [Streptomyces sp. CB01881]AUY50475.1 hypothetical protein C2142_17740 [Streptomyces sp. CB01881]TYC73862.1 hypothetical protein EH183_17720 [Streptomyces sp. CB01881]